MSIYSMSIVYNILRCLRECMLPYNMVNMHGNIINLFVKDFYIFVMRYYALGFLLKVKQSLCSSSVKRNI